MKSLYWRVWLTVVAALALFAIGSAALMHRQMGQERERWRQLMLERAPGERLAAIAELVGRSLPEPQAPRVEQEQALQEWSQRLALPMALADAQGRPIAQSESFDRAETAGPPGGRGRVALITLEDGRVLSVVRPPRGSGPGPGPGLRLGSPDREGPHPMRGAPPQGPAASPLPVPLGTGFLILLPLLFLAVAAGAWPVVRRLTRRLEGLAQGVERFGAGELAHRVDEQGGDEVARLGASFNRTAQRIQELVQSHRTLLANASHELRSPLARLKMALALLAEAPDGAARPSLQREIDTNLRELDALIDEVLLASRLEGDSRPEPGVAVAVDWLAVVADECARAGVSPPPSLGAAPLWVLGEERLLRRAVRNLLENARRYGGGAVEVSFARRPAAVPDERPRAVLSVCDRGPGVPDTLRERIFEPFFRLPGHAEHDGGVGLGLSLVRQIARRHGGEAGCEPRGGGGACFSVVLPVAPGAASTPETR